MRFLITALITITYTLSPAQADFGDNAVNWSASESSDFQDYAVRTLNKQGRIYNNYWLYFWLNEIYLTLNIASDQPISPTIPIIIDDDAINAFAMPGNIIGMNRGLWLNADTEDEFISVLAHEMSHISLDHFSRLSQNSNRQTLTLAAGVLLSMLLAQENPEVANATLISSFAATSQAQLNFSQAMETEADQLAQIMLQRTGFDPEAGRVFFQKLDANSNVENAYEFLRSHPLGNTRSSRLSQNAASEEPQPPSLVFKLLKTTLEQRPTTRSDWQKTLSLLDNRDGYDTTPSAHLEYAEALLSFAKLGNEQTFINQLEAITRTYPGFIPAAITLLNQQLTQSDVQHCEQLNAVNTKVKDQHLTLDALEIMATAAKQCQHASLPLWHSQWLWQSGKETDALNYLKTQLKFAQSTNQAAILKNRLEIMTQRYERFR